MSDYGIEIEVTKQDAQDAINNLVKFFQSYKGKFFGLDDLGIISLYVECCSVPKSSTEVLNGNK